MNYRMQTIAIINKCFKMMVIIFVIDTSVSLLGF